MEIFYFTTSPFSNSYMRIKIISTFTQPPGDKNWYHQRTTGHNGEQHASFSALAPKFSPYGPPWDGGRVAWKRKSPELPSWHLRHLEGAAVHGVRQAACGSWSRFRSMCLCFNTNSWCQVLLVNRCSIPLRIGVVQGQGSHLRYFTIIKTNFSFYTLVAFF